MNVIVVGSINKDIVFDVESIVKDGQTISSKNQQNFLGGKGLNQTIALSNVYDDVFFYCNINENDKSIIEKLNDFNFKKDYIQLVEEETGTAFIQVNEQGENAIVISKNANNHIDLDNLNNVFKNFDNNTLVLLQNEINNLTEIITLSKKFNFKVALNPSPMSKEINPTLLEKIDILIVNQGEFLEATNTSNLEDAINYTAYNLQNLEVVVTLGANGAMYLHGDTKTQVDGIKVDVVDTTCAGDTFLGFFLGNYLKGELLKDCLTRANKAASICVTVKGASNSIPNKI